MIIKNNNDFELEFCLKREVYCKAYSEDGKLWDECHEEMLKLFHIVYRTERKRIYDNIIAIAGIFIATRQEFLNAFNESEYSEEELAYVRNIIVNYYTGDNEDFEWGVKIKCK